MKFIYEYLYGCPSRRMAICGQNGKALIINEQIGKAKVMVEPQYHEIIGISILGHVQPNR
jgi:pyruvate/2-oxoglutarate dehydrogenase complex dihydrolipoamide dehydrogenase (E3) component